MDGKLFRPHAWQESKISENALIVLDFGAAQNVGKLLAALLEAEPEKGTQRGTECGLWTLAFGAEADNG